jgi:O-antigen ligase
LRALLALAVIASIATTYSPNFSVALARMVQFWILTFLTLVTFFELRAVPGSVTEFWVTLRRAMWSLAIVALIGSTAFYGIGGLTARIGASLAGESYRYQWFASHPITTASIAAVSLIMLAGAAFAVPDRLAKRSPWRAVGLALIAALGVVLIATKSRGPLFSGVGAFAILAVLTRYSGRRRAVVLIGVAGLALVLAGFGTELLDTVVRRGQTTDQFLSLTGRDEIIRASVEFFWERPLFGHGYFSGRSAFLEVAWGAGDAHSAIAEILVSTGLMGIIGYSWFFAVTGRQLARGFRSDSTGLFAEAAALAVYVLMRGVAGTAFVGSASLEVIALGWLALVVDLGVRARDPSTSISGLR